MLKGLMGGKDFNGNALNGQPRRIAWGESLRPEADPLEPQLLKFTKKAEIGLDFFQTQAVFELDRLEEFMQYARQFEAKIIIGVRLLTWEEISRLPGRFSARRAGAGLPD